LYRCRPLRHVTSDFPQRRP